MKANKYAVYRRRKRYWQALDRAFEPSHTVALYSKEEAEDLAVQLVRRDGRLGWEYKAKPFKRRNRNV